MPSEPKRKSIFSNLNTNQNKQLKQKPVQKVAPFMKKSESAEINSEPKPKEPKISSRISTLTERS